MRVRTWMTRGIALLGAVAVRGYRARRGYDLVTGVGTPNAARLVPELVALAGSRAKHSNH